MNERNWIGKFTYILKLIINWKIERSDGGGSGRAKMAWKWCGLVWFQTKEMNQRFSGMKCTGKALFWRAHSKYSYTMDGRQRENQRAIERTQNRDWNLEKCSHRSVGAGGGVEAFALTVTNRKWTIKVFHDSEVRTRWVLPCFARSTHQFGNFFSFVWRNNEQQVVRKLPPFYEWILFARARASHTRRVNAYLIYGGRSAQRKKNKWKISAINVGLAAVCFKIRAMCDAIAFTRHLSISKLKAQTS